MLAGVYVKRCDINLKKEVPLLSLSPCQLKAPRLYKEHENEGLETIGSQMNHKTNNVLLKANSEAGIGVIDWFAHDRVLSALSNGLPINEDEEAVSISTIKKGLHSLLYACYSAQRHAIASYAGVEVNSLVLGNKSLLHFVVKDYISAKYGKVHAPSNVSLGIANNNGEKWIDILYVLSAAEEPLLGDKFYAYELAFGEGKMGDNNQKWSELLLGKLDFRDPIYFYSVKERTRDKFFSSNISSFRWMGTAVSDVINSRYFSLTTVSGVLTSNQPQMVVILVLGGPTLFLFFSFFALVQGHPSFLCGERN